MEWFAFLQMEVQLPSSGGIFSSAALFLTQLSNRWRAQFCNDKNMLTLFQFVYFLYNPQGLELCRGWEFKPCDVLSVL